MDFLHDNNFKNYLAASALRLENLEKIHDITLSMKDDVNESVKLLKTPVENGQIIDDNIDEEISDFLDIRDDLIQNVKDCEVTLNHYKTKFSDELLCIVLTCEENNFNSSFSQNLVFLNLAKDNLSMSQYLSNIKKIDEEIKLMINFIMKTYKEKTKNIKTNRNVMEKYMASGEIKSGILYNKKK